MPELDPPITQQYQELFTLCAGISAAGDGILGAINERRFRIADLKPHQRIFLFILTRAVKSYAAILHLCRAGYAQDASSLLRSLLENLVTVRYILRDPAAADELTRRFVDYKWVIFKKHLPEEEKLAQAAGPDQQAAFVSKQRLITGKVDQFKSRYRVTSDRGLLTWSGRTVKDMAKMISPDLLEEYEATFRLCSRFSHASILGDQEYIVRDDLCLLFSPLPSVTGIIPHLHKTVRYFLDFLIAAESVFALGRGEEIQDLRGRAEALFAAERYRAQDLPQTPSPGLASPGPVPDIRESIIRFKIRPPDAAR